MKISEAIKTLTDVLAKYGDIRITGGNMTDDINLVSITVTDKSGMECWPNDPNGIGERKPEEIDGVFLS